MSLLSLWIKEDWWMGGTTAAPSERGGGTPPLPVVVAAPEAAGDPWWTRREQHRKTVLTMGIYGNLDSDYDNELVFTGIKRFLSLLQLKTKDNRFLSPTDSSLESDNNPVNNNSVAWHAVFLKSQLYIFNISCQLKNWTGLFYHVYLFISLCFKCV